MLSPKNRVGPSFQQLQPLPNRQRSQTLPTGKGGRTNGAAEGRDTPPSTVEREERMDQLAPLRSDVREQSWLEDPSGSDSEKKPNRGESRRFGSGGIGTTLQSHLTTNKEGDPHIEMSLTIKPLPSLIPPSPPVEGASKEQMQEFAKKRRQQIQKFNEHLVVPPETIFPEDSVGDTSGTITLRFSMLRHLHENSSAGKPQWEKFFPNVTSSQELSLSPPARITLSLPDRHKAGIPDEAVFYSFAYPIEPLENKKMWEADKYQEISEELLYTWLTVGAFVYFEEFSPMRRNFLEKTDTGKGVTVIGDQTSSLKRANNQHSPDLFEKPPKHNIVAVNCISKITEGVDHEANLFFGKCLIMPETAIAELDQDSVRTGGKRWHNVTQRDLKGERHTQGDYYTHFAWVLPSERLGDDSFFYSRDGGFAYKRKSGKGEYYPVLHAQSQLMIAHYLRHKRKPDVSQYKPAEQRAALKELISLQEGLPKKIAKEYVAELKSVRQSHDEKPVWTVYKIYRLNVQGNAVRSDFKEVYRLKIWDQAKHWNRSRVEEEAKLMITIQNPIHHASHALLHEYEIKDEEELKKEDNGSMEAPFYFKMSHIEGQTLAHAIKNGDKFSDFDVAKAATHVLKGLSEVHRHNFIHTDINAGNVMRVRGSQGYNHVILDVGLARKGSANKKIPDNLEHMVRQVDYIPPEMFDARWHHWGEGETGPEMDTDLRSDIWSVGVLMFYMLARREQLTEEQVREIDSVASMKHQDSLMRDVGQVNEARPVGFRTGILPFSDDKYGKRKEPENVRMEICDMTKLPPKVDRLVPDEDRSMLNTTLLEVIFKAMSKQPNDRYKDAMEMATTIDAAFSTKRLKEYTIFISYRQSTDAGLAQILYDELNNATTPKGHRVTVFLDRVRLQDGEDWEQGFLEGLTQSRIYMPILSYGFTGPLAYLSTTSSIWNWWSKGDPESQLESRPAEKTRLKPRSNRAFLGVFWGWHDAEDNCLKELQLAERLIQTKGNRNHKTSSILPVFVGRQGPYGKIMDFFSDLSNGAGGKYSTHASQKTKQKVEMFLKQKDVDMSHADMSKFTDWSIKGTMDRIFKIQGIFLHKEQPKKINELQFVERALDRQRQVAETSMQNRSHKVAGDWLTTTVVVKVPVYPSVESLQRDRSYKVWIEDVVVKKIQLLAGGADVNQVVVRSADEEITEQSNFTFHKGRIQMIRITVKATIPKNFDSGVVSKVESAIMIDNINAMMKGTGVHLCQRQRKTQSKKRLSELKPGSRTDTLYKFTDGLLPKTEDDPDGMKYHKLLLVKLHEKFPTKHQAPGNTPSELRVEFAADTVMDNVSARSLFVIPIDVKSNAENQLKNTAGKDVAKFLSDLGLNGVTVDITGDLQNGKEQGTADLQDGKEQGTADATKDKNWEKTLGVPGPLNSDQVNILRRAAQNCKQKILDAVDLETPPPKTSAPWADRLHYYIPYVIICIILSAAAVLFGMRFWSCSVNSIKVFGLLCQSCPEGQGTGGREGATRCRPSCWGWRDSLNRSCVDYENEPDWCDASDSFRDLNGVDANQACYACMVDRQSTQGCVASNLAVQAVTDDNGIIGNPIGLAPSPDNSTLYIADSKAHRIVALSVADQTNPTVVCGGGSAAAGIGAKTPGYVDQNDPEIALFREPQGLAVDPWQRTMYVADTGNNAIRQVDLNGFSVTTFAGGGGGTGGFGKKDGTGTNALFHSPVGVAFAAGIVYVSDTGNNLIRKIVVSTRQVTTLSGMGTPGLLDVGAGASSSAMFYSPTGIAATSFGTLLVADTENNVIRSLDLETGAVETLAGGGYGNQDGEGDSARFQFPWGLSVSPDGKSAYVTDRAVLGRISKVGLSDRVVSTVAGNPQQRPFCRFDHPTDVQVVVLGDKQYLFVAEGDSTLKFQSGYSTLRVLISPVDVDVEEKAALIIIDVQDCFLDRGTRSGDPGSLPVANSYPIVPVINSLKNNSCLFDLVVKTADYHPPNHTSFAAAHGVPILYNEGGGGITLTCTRTSGGSMSEASCCPKWNATGGSFECPDRQKGCPVQGRASDPNNNPACVLCKNLPELCFEMQQMMWPTHCLQRKPDGSNGDWEFAEDLEIFTEADGSLNEIVVNIGKYPYIDSYSAFMDNTKQLKTELDSVLKAQGITTLYLTGLATDFTVRWTIEDAVALGYKVKLITDGVKGLYLDSSQGTYDEQNERQLEIFESWGVELLNSTQVLALQCNNTVIPGGDMDDDNGQRGPPGERKDPLGSGVPAMAPTLYFSLISSALSVFYALLLEHF